VASSLFLSLDSVDLSPSHCIGTSQRRKKRRKLEVETEKGVPLSTAEEFRGSALLGKRKSMQDPLDESYSAATAKLEEGCQLILFLLARLEADEKKILSREQQMSSSSSQLPSPLMQSHSLPTFPLRTPLPLPSQNSTSTSCSCSCRTSSSSSSLDHTSPTSVSTLMALCDCSCLDCTLSSQLLSDLRQSLSALFFLEADSYKWYKDDSIPYFLKLGSRLDLLLHQNSPPLVTTSSHCPSTSYLSHLIASSFIPSLKIEIEAVTRILLLFPTGCAGGIPEEFRKVDLEGRGGKWKIKEYDIEDDGFEIIDGQNK
jgi:hypothetical protein